MSWFYDCHLKTHTDSFVPTEWTDHLNLMNVIGLLLWQDVWWAPRRKLCGFFKIKRRQDVATRADIGFVPDRWTVELMLSIIVIIIHSDLLLARVFKFQKLFVVLLLWGGNNFNLVLDDKKDISIFWYTWSYLQVSVNVQKCLKWKWLQYKLGILSLNFSDRVLQNTMPHTVAKSNISDIHLYFSNLFILQNKRNDVQSEDQCLNLGTFLPFFPSSRHCNIFVLKSYVGSYRKK